MDPVHSGNAAAASIPQIAPLAKYKLVFLGDQVICCLNSSLVPLLINASWLSERGKDINYHPLHV
jgi:hypothetical protein